MLDKQNLVQDKYHNEYPEGGFCVAGVEEGERDSFVRLIGNHDSYKITYNELTYRDGTICEPLDIIEVEGDFASDLTKAKNTLVDSEGFYELDDVQPENFLVKNKPFKYIESLSFNDIVETVKEEENSYIFTDKYDYLTVDEAEDNNYSLTLCEVTNLKLYPQKKYGSFKKHFKAKFIFNGEEYDNITVTDPEYYPEDYDYDEYIVGDAYLFLSVGEKFNGYHYKLIAKIFESVYEAENNYLKYFHIDKKCKYIRNKKIKYLTYQEALDQNMKKCNECG